MKRAIFSAGLIAGVTVLVGCRQERPVPFEPNLVHAHRYVVSQDLPMNQVVEDTQWALERLFGTPDDPKVPQVVREDEDLSQLISLERLQRAAGPIEPVGSEEGGGLYRRHCAICHGVSGNGRGPNVAVVTPYPRDFRAGVFKFKSTTRGAKPTRQDLFGSIRHGIPGTAMVPIKELSDEDVQALVDYVIYLAWRGEVERQTIDIAALDLDLAGGERVIRPDLAHLQDVELEELTEEESEQLDEFEERVEAAAEQMEDKLTERELDSLDDVTVQQRVASLSGDEELRDLAAELQDLLERKRKLDNQELFEEQWEYVVETVMDVGSSWLDAEEEVTEVVEKGDIPVPQDYAEFAAMMSGPQAEALQASVERGRELFISEAVGCAKCHGKEGRGDGQTNDYDDWTKEWTTQIGLDPKNTEALVPLMARGGLPPRNIHPRNFSEGVFRGGNSPEELYRRITNGIAGTPMPAATFIEGRFEPQDVWHLINFIRSLKGTDPQEGASEQGGPSEAAGPSEEVGPGEAAPPQPQSA